jgi:hypothetical protein
MSEMEQQQPAPEAEFDELATLRARADMMGIKYHPSTGVDKLKAKINNALSGIKADSPLGDDPDVKVLNSGAKNYISEKEFQEEEFKLRRQNAGKLVRVRVTCMNPSKKDWDGEIISVGSAKMGTFKKFVKFNAEDGWHIPHIIYEYMKERKCSIFHTVTDHTGQKVRKAKQVNEFSIEVLPALTKEELKLLAQQQAMAEGKDA